MVRTFGGQHKYVLKANTNFSGTSMTSRRRHGRTIRLPGRRTVLLRTNTRPRMVIRCCSTSQHQLRKPQPTHRLNLQPLPSRRCWGSGRQQRLLHHRLQQRYTLELRLWLHLLRSLFRQLMVRSVIAGQLQKAHLASAAQAHFSLMRLRRALLRLRLVVHLSWPPPA